MPSEHLDYLHAGHIRLAVSEIDHVREGYPFLVLGLAFVDQLVVPDAEYALVYLEEELGLGRVVHRHPGPYRFAVLIVEEGTGENALEFPGDRGALDYLCKPGRVDVVFHRHSVLLAVAFGQLEPFLYSAEEFHLPSEILEVLLSQPDTLVAGLVEHQLHIAEYVACILVDGNLVTHLPELLRTLFYCLYEAEFLHIARRECSVEVVNKSYYGFLHFSNALRSVYGEEG